MCVLFASSRYVVCRIWNALLAAKTCSGSAHLELSSTAAEEAVKRNSTTMEVGRILVVPDADAPPTTEKEAVGSDPDADSAAWEAAALAAEQAMAKRHAAKKAARAAFHSSPET